MGYLFGRKIKYYNSPNRVNGLKKLKKSHKNTRNGIVINDADEKEGYLVKNCPYCQEDINKDAIKCNHCEKEVRKGFKILDDRTHVANII